MNEATHWVHDLDPRIIHIYGDFGVSYYGLAYVVGFLFAMGMHRIMMRRGRSPFNPAHEELILYATVLGLLIGARVGYCLLYATEDLLRRPWMIVEVWHGGMSFHGGFVGMIVACWYVRRRTRIGMLQFSDIIAAVAPMGLLLGRIANFINGELWGRITTVPWAVIFPRSLPGVDPALVPARHPSQLYEAALQGAVLLALMQWRFWKTDARRHPGRMTGEFMTLYAVFRIFCEFFREPDASLILGMSRGTFYSLFVGVAGIVFILRSYRPGDAPCPKPPPVAPPAARAKKSRRK